MSSVRLIMEVAGNPPDAEARHTMGGGAVAAEVARYVRIAGERHAHGRLRRRRAGNVGNPSRRTRAFGISARLAPHGPASRRETSRGTGSWIGFGEALERRSLTGAPVCPPRDLPSHRR